MFDRELTQLISTAKHYLDAADSLLVSDSDLARTVSADSAAWSVDRQPRALLLLTRTPLISQVVRCDWRPSMRFWLAVQRRLGPSHIRTMRRSLMTT